MSGSYSYWKTSLILIACCVLVAASGCRRRPGKVQENPVETAPVVQEAAPEPETPQPDPAPEAVPEPDPTPPPMSLAVLLSAEAPQYESVRWALVEVAGEANATVYSLDSQANLPASVVHELTASGPRNVVAIGLPAALAARGLSSRFVFCQVLNHEGQGLISETSRGIETIPNLARAIDLWKELDPDLRRIGLIVGSGHAARVAQARATFAERGIELVHRTSQSDKETLLEFQRLLPGIDGYWMFPDNRILSSSTIREIMSLARRSKIGVLANDPGFHQIGAFICATHDPTEIARRAYEVLEEARGEDAFEGRAMTPLTDCLISVRADIATQLGYATDKIPSSVLVR